MSWCCLGVCDTAQAQGEGRVGGQTKFAGGGASADLRESDWSVNSTARLDERYHSSRERYRARAHLRQNARTATKQELSLLGPACLGAACSSVLFLQIRH